MGLFTGIHIGKEAMSTHAFALNTVSNNLANMNTPGYKTDRPEFETLLADSMGSLLEDPTGSGNGVRPTDASMILTQGTIDATGRDLDLAVDGNGYFIVRNANGGKPIDLFTRAGNFETDPEGNIVTKSGEQVLGYTTASPTTPVPINIRNVTTSATPSANVAITGNLNSGAALGTVPAGGATFTQISAAAEFRNSISLTDSLGAAHNVSLFFYHTGPTAWTAQAYVDGAETGGTAGTPVLVGTSTITTDNTGAQAAGATPMTINAAWNNGAAAQTTTLDTSGMTGFSSPSNVGSVTNDGVPNGAVSSISVGTDGSILASLTNGQTVTIAQLALAGFNNPGGLTKLTNNNFGAGSATGEQITGKPETSGFGRIRGASLELSNVDPATQFIDLIQYQRGYQAGSQVVSTFNEIIRTTLQLA